MKVLHNSVKFLEGVFNATKVLEVTRMFHKFLLDLEGSSRFKKVLGKSRSLNINLVLNVKEKQYGFKSVKKHFV